MFIELSDKLFPFYLFYLFLFLFFGFIFYFIFSFLVMTEIVALTRTEVLPNPTLFRCSFWTSSYPGKLLRRPNTLLPPQQAPRHQARRYTSSLSTSAHSPRTPAACEETFVKCAFYYSIFCWEKYSESSYKQWWKKGLGNKCFMFYALFYKSCNPAPLAGSFDAHAVLPFSQ